MNCKHSKRRGDNYGVSCQDCKQVLEGYGYGGWFGRNLKGSKRCLHRKKWWKINDVEEQCPYCETTRIAPSIVRRMTGEGAAEENGN